MFKSYFAQLEEVAIKDGLTAFDFTGLFVAAIQREIYISTPNEFEGSYITSRFIFPEGKNPQWHVELNYFVNTRKMCFAQVHEMDGCKTAEEIPKSSRKFVREAWLAKQYLTLGQS